VELIGRERETSDVLAVLAKGTRVVTLRAARAEGHDLEVLVGHYRRRAF